MRHLRTMPTLAGLSPLPHLQRLQTLPGWAYLQRSKGARGDPAGRQRR